MKRNQPAVWGSLPFEVGSSVPVPRWIWISVLSSLGVLLLGLVSASPIAERRAHSEAERRGLLLEMEDFSLGWFNTEMNGVRVRLEGVEQIDVRVQRLRIEFSLFAPRLRHVEAEGGKVTITGSFDDVRHALSRWRAAHSKKATRSEKGSPPELRRSEVLRDFEIEWRGAFDDSDEQLVSGLQFQRGPQGLRIGADLVEASKGGMTAQVAGALLEAKTATLDLSEADSLGAAEMRVIYDAPLDESDQARAPPQSNGTPPAPPKVTADGRDEGDEGDDESDNDGLDQQLEKNSLRVARLVDAIALIRNEVRPKLPQKSQVEKFWVTYKRGDERLHVGPSLLTVEKQNGLTVRIIPKGNAKGTPLTLGLTVHPKDFAEAAISVDLKGGPVSLATLGIAEGAFGLSGVQHTHVSGSFSAKLNQQASTVSGEGEAFIDGLSLDSAKLSENLVTFPKLMVAGSGEMRVDGSLIHIEDATLRMGETNFQGSFEMEGGEDFATLKASASAPLVSCQALLDSAPRGLLGAAERMKFDGTFSLDFGVEADTRQLGDMKVRWDFKNGCRVTAVPAELDPERFRTLFRREVIGAGNFPMELEFGPYSTHWVPWEEVSPYVEKALLVTEDGRFFRHDGFDDRAIESAIRDNVKSGKFVRGASTISMQLAKNLYLSRKKTLARKFQEAALTSLLEQNFEKRELLELYVNVVEFGPGVYGIRRAAEHYFATTPTRLTPAQSFFIASILPAPTRNYFDEAGNLIESRAAFVQRLLEISHARDALTDSELEQALQEQLVFGRPETLPEPEEGKVTEEESQRRPGDDSSRTSTSSRNEKRNTKTDPPPPPRLSDEPIFPKR